MSSLEIFVRNVSQSDTLQATGERLLRAECKKAKEASMPSLALFSTLAP